MENNDQHVDNNIHERQEEMMIQSHDDVAVHESDDVALESKLEKESVGDCEVSGLVESGDVALESEKGVIENCEISGLVESGDVALEMEKEKGGVGNCEVSGLVESSNVALESEKGEEKGVIGNCETSGLVDGDGMGLKLVESGTEVVGEFIGGDRGVSDSIGGEHVSVVEENVKSEIVGSTDIGVEDAIGNLESVVQELDDTMNDRMGGGVSVIKENMEINICVESSVRMSEGSQSEDVPTSCATVVENERIVVVANGENDEERKRVEIEDSDVWENEKDEVKGEGEGNDEFKGTMEGNSSLGGDKLDAEKEVGMREECSDSKEVDSESTVSESLVDNSAKDEEVEGKEEGGDGGVKMETVANSEADTVDIKKEEEPEAATGDSDEEMAPQEETNGDTEMDTETDGGEPDKTASGKRKRGKNRIHADSNSTPKAGNTTEEDVCFICFDGGALVLCDRRGCPKAYHPYCVNQDETFFVGKKRWNCGWHMCSICEKKSAHYMCYTCPFSLCKGCVKDAVIFCVRGKKGFCETCMKFVKILENDEQGVNDVQVKFDDKGSWEYLFRDYFTELKSKLSISSAEIAEAKSPWKGLDTSAGKDDKPRSGMQGNHDVKQVKKRMKTRGKRQTSYSAAEPISDEDGPLNTEWASKELLEFVMHMRGGDRSILSEFDVQALLLEYIKRNNLRDPRQKSRIICDLRLQSLFGKPRVGHFEMLKLLESHFFVKEDSQTGDVQPSVVDTNSEQLDLDADTPKGTKEKKRKSRKKGDRRGAQSNFDDYAAIDMHNISVIYLRRKLMEDLLEDSETFQDKVVGTFVRIRISGSVQKQDIYRLVQVVGTSNAAEPYKVGKKTTNIMVEILNLNKTEVISMDTVSNQDFTEDECKRLRQSIKCGLINRLTVGDILDKATDLQTAKVNDWLETEVVRLSHLRDRASEKGRKKELRECVEKLQLLKTPEERLRRLDEIPEIHADPKMDPTYESEEDNVEVDENRQDVNTKIRGPGSRGGRGQISPGSEILSKNPFSGGSRYSSKNFELDRNLSSKNLLSKGGDNTTHFGEVQGETAWNQVRHRTSPESSNLDKFGSTVVSDTLGWNSYDVPKTESLSPSVSKAAPALAKAAESTKINESEKNWYYKDPSAKVQGPFSIIQLRKWNNTGYFPAGLKVWRSNEREEDSILLTDALSGKFLKESTGAASVLPSSLSANLTNIMASLENAREQKDRDKPRSDQDATGNLPSHFVSPRGQPAPSVEHLKLSTERWTRSESSRLPSPTPIRNTAVLTREGGSLSSATYFGSNSVLPSPTAVAPDYQGRSSTPTSGLRFGETLRACENDPVSTRLNGVQVGLPNASNTSPNLQAAMSTEARTTHLHGNVAVAQDSFVPQTVSNQNPITGTPGWGIAQPQIVDSNAALPVQPQIQSYGQWGNIPAAGYTHPGNFQQGNQPNMQFTALPNTTWAVGMPESNTTTVPAPRTEIPNPNFGWGVMQGSQNTPWVGAPPTNANVNWGAAPFQGPPTANQSMGWTMPPGNIGAAAQGQLPAVSPWTSGTKNPPVQGLPPAGNVHQSWVAQTGNIPSNVHMPASGTGWNPTPANLGAPVPGMVPGHANQGWGTDQKHSGGQFSNQRDQGSHGGDSGYGGNRSLIRPSSFANGGSGGPSRHVARHQMPCPFNRDGRCRKGSACDFLHN